MIAVGMQFDDYQIVCVEQEYDAFDRVRQFRAQHMFPSCTKFSVLPGTKLSDSPSETDASSVIHDTLTSFRLSKRIGHLIAPVLPTKVLLITRKSNSTLLVTSHAARVEQATPQEDLILISTQFTPLSTHPPDSPS
jgi:hypothetical protein